MASDKLKPLTFKVPQYMLLKMEEMVKKGAYDSRAELIREAIQKLIDWELIIDPVSGFEQ